MRSVDTNMLKALGAPGAGPWRTEDGRVLRVLSGGRPIPTKNEALAMLQTYRASATVAGTPQAHEVVRIAGGYGVVVDYVVGLGLGVHLAIGSFTSDEAGHAMGEAKRMGIDEQVAKCVARAIWDGLLETYFEDMSAHEREAIDRGLAALSEVERCCYNYGIARMAPSTMRQFQQDRLSLCADRLTTLLPKVERLDF